MGLTTIGDHQVAAVVTALEMRARPPLRPMPASSLRLVEWPRPDPAKYRALFSRVGAPWLWFSRLAMTEQRLVDIIHDPNVKIHAAVDAQGVEVGMLELDFRRRAACELSYFALIPELVGQGLGRWLMAEALARAWSPGIARVWVHTCTLDHPRALGFYIRSGFTPYRRSVEIFDDPRLTGALPPDAAPQIPLFNETGVGS